MTALQSTFGLYRWHNGCAGRLLIIFAAMLSLPAFGDPNPTPIATNDTSAAASMAKANLGDLAEIEVPKGFRLIDTNRASAFLRQTGNRAPAGFLGILAHDSANWFAVIDFTEIGFLKDAEKQGLDSNAILQGVRNKVAHDNVIAAQHNIPQILSVEWEQAPVYDPTSHMFAWAIRVETQLARTINYSVALLGRKGLLEITAVQPSGTGTGLTPLQELAKKITFNDGLRYEDYQNGDKLAALTIQDMIVNDQERAQQEKAAAGRFVGSWIFFTLIGCVVLSGLVGCVILLKRLARREIYTPEYGTQTIASLIANGTASHRGNGNGNGNGSPHKQLSTEPIARSNGKGAKSGGGRNGRRRVAFDYSKFYVDFVMSSTNATAHGVLNEMSSLALGETTPVPEVSASSETRPRSGTSSEDLELVERLRILIEEQKRLIHQQTRLIEEKNKFIEEQNEFLERQSALVKDQFTLKLD